VSSFLLSATLAVTVAAVDRSVAGGFERHGGGGAALGANRLEHRARSAASTVIASATAGSPSTAIAIAAATSTTLAAAWLVGLPLLTTRPATLRLVGKASFGVPLLVFGAVLEIAAAVLADEEFVFKRHVSAFAAYS
jgi:hypothetical protein